MLSWYEENGKMIGFDDDALMYRVGFEDGSWYYEQIHDLYGVYGYNTALEAMAAANEDYEAHRCYVALEDDEPFDPEEAFMVLADLLYEQRRDERMGW